MLACTIQDLVADETPQEVDERIKRILKNGAELFTTRHRRKDGTLFHVEVSVTSLINDRVMLVCFCRDITERNNAEKLLRHSHDFMSYIIEHSRSGVAVHDRDLKYMYVSKRYLESYKVREKDVIGKHHYEVFPDLPQKWRDIHLRSLNGEILSADEDAYKREDGRIDWTRWECRPWYKTDGSTGVTIHIQKNMAVPALGFP